MRASQEGYWQCSLGTADDRAVGSTINLALVEEQSFWGSDSLQWEEGFTDDSSKAEKPLVSGLNDLAFLRPGQDLGSHSTTQPC